MLGFVNLGCEQPQATSSKLSYQITYFSFTGAVCLNAHHPTMPVTYWRRYHV